MLFSSPLVALSIYSFTFSTTLAKWVPTVDRIPSRAVMMDHDTVNHIFIAYDVNGTEIAHIPELHHIPSLDKRLPGSCSRLSAGDIQKLPGWGKLRGIAVERWGGDYDTVDANPQEYRDRSATVCVANEVTKVKLQSPSCIDPGSQVVNGTTSGRSLDVTLTAEQGTTSRHLVNVDSQASVAVGATFGATLEIPEVADVSVQHSVGVKFTNTQNERDEQTVTNMQTQRITMYAEPDTRCELVVERRRCDVEGSGEQRLVAHGWAWFYYGHLVDGHYKKALNMDSLLSEEERSTVIKFRTSSGIDMSAQYRASCDKPLQDKPKNLVGPQRLALYGAAASPKVSSTVTQFGM